MGRCARFAADTMQEDPPSKQTHQQPPLGHGNGISENIPVIPSLRITYIMPSA
jgi:hypothetical protein